MKLGDKVRLTSDVDYLPHCIVPKGTQGTIVYTGPEVDGVEIRLHDYFRGLREYDNRLWLVWPDTDAIQVVRRTTWKCWLKRAGASLVPFLGWGTVVYASISLVDDLTDLFF
jgi:hypothetical protein